MEISDSDRVDVSFYQGDEGQLTAWMNVFVTWQDMGKEGIGECEATNMYPLWDFYDGLYG